MPTPGDYDPHDGGMRTSSDVRLIGWLLGGTALLGGGFLVLMRACAFGEFPRRTCSPGATLDWLLTQGGWWKLAIALVVFFAWAWTDLRASSRKRS